MTDKDIFLLEVSVTEHIEKDVHTLRDVYVYSSVTNAQEAAERLVYLYDKTGRLEWYKFVGGETWTTMHGIRQGDSEFVIAFLLYEPSIDTPVCIHESI